MPELPDIVVYLERLEAIAGHGPLLRLRIASPWVLRTFAPPPEAAAGRRVIAYRRIGKRIVLCLEGDLSIVIHLMVAGRLRLRPPGAAIPGRRGLAAIDFPGATFLLTEEGTKRRAAIHLVEGDDALAALDPGGVEPLDSSPGEFAAALMRGRHTLKRSLTDPRIIAGIGGAYADEIMHRARLSPLVLTDRLTAEDIVLLHAATQEVLTEWTQRLRSEAGEGFPEKVTAFHPEMSVHGRFGLPCPVCGAPVQRIVHADNETNYCARCQTGGRIFADRALSRLLKQDFPRDIEDLE